MGKTLTEEDVTEFGPWTYIAPIEKKKKRRKRRARSRPTIEESYDNPANESVRAPDGLLKQNKITQAQWRSRKRAELRAILKATEKYRLGCAYCPGYDADIAALSIVLSRMTATHSVKNWTGRSFGRDEK